MKLRALVIALAFGGLTAVLLVLYLQRFGVETSGGAPVRVVTVVKTMAPGTLVSADMLAIRSIPQAFVEPRAVRESDLPRVVGIKVETPVKAQNTLLWTDLAVTTEDRRNLSGLVQPGMRAVSIRSLSDGRHAALIRPGDRVDVVANVSRESDKDRVSVLVAQNLLVLAVGLDMGGDALGAAAAAPVDRSELVITVSATIQQLQQLAGEDATPHADVYAAGVVLWQLLTGHELFPGEHDGDVLASRMASYLPPSPLTHRDDLPAPLVACVMRAIAPMPEDRFASAAEMAAALEAAAPPASPGQVADWLATASEELLATRAAQRAEAEASGAASLRPPPRAVMTKTLVLPGEPGVTFTRTMVDPSRGPPPKPEHAAPAAALRNATVPIDAPPVDRASFAPPPPLPPAPPPVPSSRRDAAPWTVAPRPKYAPYLVAGVSLGAVALAGIIAFFYASYGLPAAGALLVAAPARSVSEVSSSEPPTASAAASGDESPDAGSTIDEAPRPRLLKPVHPPMGRPSPRDPQPRSSKSTR